MSSSPTDAPAPAPGALPRRPTAWFAPGIAAGPIYVSVGVVQIVARDGFDVRRHALSQLAHGEGGWVQVANFLVCGALVIAGALACRGAMRSRPGGTWGPLLLGLFGLGMIGAGLFPADPAAGFPPGVPAPEELSRSGLLHFVFGGSGFYALIAACLVFARHFARSGQRPMAWFSIATGALFFASFGAVASGSTSPIVMLAFYGANAWMWAWLTITMVQVARGVRRSATLALPPAVESC